MKVTFYVIAFASCLFCQVQLVPINIFGSLRNATLSATSFLTDTIERQTNFILQVKDNAVEYVSNVVEMPKNALLQARQATKEYIDDTASRGLEMKFRLLLEGLRPTMRMGIPAFGVPVLEPLTIKRRYFETHDPEIGDVSVTLENVTVHRLSTYVINHAKLSVMSGPSIVVNLTVPKITAEGFYTAKGKVGNTFELDGKGPFEIEVNEARAYVHAVLGYSGKLYLSELKLDCSIKSMALHVHRLFNNEEVDKTMSKVISEIGPEMLELLKPDVLPEMTKMIGEQVNGTISRLTMGNVIGILTGSTNIGDFVHLTSTHALLPT